MSGESNDKVRMSGESKRVLLRASRVARAVRLLERRSHQALVGHQTATIINREAALAAVLNEALILRHAQDER